MLNTDLIFKKNNRTKRIGKTSRSNRISVMSESFTSQTLALLVDKLNALNGLVLIKGELVLDFGTVRFKDKVTFLILESIVYHLCKKFSCSIAVLMNVEPQYMANNVFFGSPLHLSIVETGGYVDKKKFLSLYEKPRITPDMGCLRTYIKHSDLQKNDLYPSEIYSEVPVVLLPFFEDEDWVGEVAEVVSELVCNVSSHTLGDCLLHIDCARVENEITGHKAKRLSIAVINYDTNRLFEKVKENIENKKYNENETPYKEVYKAYDKHHQFFDDRYCKDDFFLISTFQNHVTSRSHEASCYGTGLTTLIKKIHGKTDAYYSYVLSGYNVLFFVDEYLAASEDGFFGFNNEKDFINYPPELDIIAKSELYVPGTVYLLVLIKE